MAERGRYAGLVAALPSVVPFVPPEALERRIGAQLRLRIGANESNFGPSPRAVAAMRGAGAVEPRGLMFMLAQDSDRAEC